MKSIRLGRSGLKVSPLCLGTMTFANTTSRGEAQRIADRALDAGAYFWDTADMYSTGACEQMVGELLKGRRHQVVLATKVFAQMSEGPNDRGLSRFHLLDAVEGSLKRLQTDHIDLYYLHLPDRETPLQETLRTCEDLLRSGKVRYLGASNFRAWEVMRLLGIQDRFGWERIAAVQPLYNLCNRQIEGEMLPMCDEVGLGVVSYSPLARGVLTNKYADFSEGVVPDNSRLERQDKRFMQAEWRQESVAVGQGLSWLARDVGCDTASLAVAWAMANTKVHSVIAGPRTLEQLEVYLAGASLDWTPALEQACDALVPPGCWTGRTAPDPAYSPIEGRVV